MTWKRVVGRNHLDNPDYVWHDSPMAVAWSTLEESTPEYLIRLMHVMVEHQNEQAERFNAKIGSLSADVARFEQDSVDEAAVCRMISEMTELDVDDVAAVIRVFLSNI